MLKTTKSWKLTLISFLLAAGVPFVNDALVPYGIIITESEANYFLMMLFGISATGAGVSINKKINERKMKEAETKNIQPVVVQPQQQQQQQQQQQPAHTATAQQVNTASIPASPGPAPVSGGDTDERPRGNDNIPIPKLGPEGSKYQHNFKNDSSLGNVLDYGQSYLYLRLKGARSYVTAQLKDHAGKLLQIEQAKPGNCTCRLEMFDSVGNPLPRGKYSVTVQGDAGTGDSQGINNDVFHIV